MELLAETVNATLLFPVPPEFVRTSQGALLAAAQTDPEGETETFTLPVPPVLPMLTSEADTVTMGLARSTKRIRLLASAM